MPLLEDAKRTIERVTGLGRPTAKDLALLTQSRKPHLLRFKDDGETPNNARCQMIFYRSPVKLRQDFDPAAIFEELFEANGWKDSWRDGMYDYLHFHTHTHEVLGIARGTVRAALRLLEKEERQELHHQPRPDVRRKGGSSRAG